LGYSSAAAAIQSELKSLVADLPDLLSASMLDDTPAANGETLAWIKEITPAAQPAYGYPAPPPMQEASGETPDAHKPEDPGDIAMRAAREGRPQEAIEILTREAAAERSGRGRFQRRLQLAQLCMSMGHERIAHPILEQLVAEIDNRSLEGWESSETVAHVLALLFRCLNKLNSGEERKQAIYDRICRLDPLQALSSMS
jgi:type VI secretion system protein ImpA